jgi:hypothetical protein
MAVATLLTKKRLTELVRKYNQTFAMKGYSRMNKVEMIKELKNRNYKPEYNFNSKQFELKPIKDPKRFKILK